MIDKLNDSILVLGILITHSFSQTNFCRTVLDSKDKRKIPGVIIQYGNSQEYYIISDENVFYIAVMITVANVHNSKAVSLLIQVFKKLCLSVRTIVADGGYRGQLFENIRNTFSYVLQIISVVIKNKDLDLSKVDG